MKGRRAKGTSGGTTDETQTRRGRGLAPARRDRGRGGDAGNAPADAPADDRSQADESDEEAAENASERRGPPADIPAAADEENTSQGPPADLPAQVPDFVSDVHDAIRNHEGGADADPLGDLVSSLTPGDGGEESGAPDGTPANGQ